MKKIFPILFILLLIQPVHAVELHKKFNLNNNSEVQAGKILYDFVLKDLNMTPEQVEDFANITPVSAKALEFDLNNDGEKEIIGLVYSTFYHGSAGYTLFILQKKLGEYRNIAYTINFEPQKDFYILKTGTNGYKDIKLYGSGTYKPFIVKYKNGLYQNKSQTKSLEKALH